MFFVVLEAIIHPENRMTIVERGDVIGPEDIAQMKTLGIDNFKVIVCLSESALNATIESM